MAQHSYGGFDETNLLKLIRAKVGNGSNRLFRNNVGVAKHDDGSIVAYGLCTGSSDLIGWHQLTITPEMVGKKVAIFTALEVKRPNRYPSPEQRKFIAAVQERGGIAGVARSPEDAEKVISAYVAGLCSTNNNV